MKKRIYFCVPFFFFWLLFLATGSEGAERDKKGPEKFFSITLENDLFSIEADNIPLDVLISGFYEKTGVKFITPGGSLPSGNVSLSFKKLPLDEIVSRLLKGYNYILINEGSPVSSRVIILTSGGSVGTFQGGFEQGGDISHSSSQTSLGPKTLDECVKLEITIADIRLERVNRPSLSKTNDNLMFEKDRKDINEAKIKRAQKVLEMDACSHLWENALEELINLQDEQVTALLSGFAVNGKHASLRGKATEILIRNTAKYGYKDLLAIEALKNLASSSDSGVSQKAQQALQEFERYIQRTKLSPKEGIRGLNKPNS